MNGTRGLFPSNYVEPCAAPANAPISPTATTGVVSRSPFNNNNNKPPVTPSHIEMKSNTGGGMFGQQQSKPPVASNIFSHHQTSSSIPPPINKSGGNGSDSRGPTMQPIYDAKPLLAPAPHVSKTVDFHKSIPKGKTKFGYWASNMAYLTAYWLIPAGCYSMFWYFQVRININRTNNQNNKNNNKNNNNGFDRSRY